MKAEMSEDGVITIRPESSVEAYALREWVGGSLVEIADLPRNEAAHWRASRIKVDSSWLSRADITHGATS